MSNTETVPVELTCPGGTPGAGGVEVLSARERRRIDGYTGTPRRLPAPALPNARITPRSRR